MRVRSTGLSDLEPLLDMQERAATVALAHIFPQDKYPFPRSDVRQRWVAEINDPGIEAYIAIDRADSIVGFLACRANELLHFGTAIEHWGSGLADELHAWAIDSLDRSTPRDIRYARLRVFEENLRARRFYEKHGWQSAGVETRTRFPPYPTLIEYTRPFDIRTRPCGGRDL